MYHYTTLYNQLIGIIFIYLVQLNQIGIIFLLSSSGYSASGYTPQSAVHVLLHLVIAHITYDFIHNYFLNSRFVMQDGIIHRIFNEQEPICVLSSSTSDSSSHHYTFQCIGLSQRLFILLPSVVTAFFFFNCL